MRSNSHPYMGHSYMCHPYMGPPYMCHPYIHVGHPYVYIWVNHILVTVALEQTVHFSKQIISLDNYLCILFAQSSLLSLLIPSSISSRSKAAACSIFTKWTMKTFTGKHIDNWMVPWKAGLSTYFVAIFQVAQNPLKFGMLTLFVSKSVPVFFFSRRQKNIDQIARKSTPPPFLPLCPSPNIVGFRLLRTKTPCMCVLYAIGGGGGGGGRRGGVEFQECVWSLVPRLWKKRKHSHFLTQKESACQISADSEQLEKSQRNGYLRLPSTEPFNC